jgi:hypothetical protein
MFTDFFDVEKKKKTKKKRKKKEKRKQRLNFQKYSDERDLG